MKEQEEEKMRFYADRIIDTYERAPNKTDAHRCNVWYVNGLSDGRAIGVFAANALYTLNSRLGKDYGVFDEDECLKEIKDAALQWKKRKEEI